MARFRGSQKESEDPSLRFLNDDRCRKVHEATLDLLERTGVWIGQPECLEMLRGAGARIVDTSPKTGSRYSRRVQFPPYLVEEAIRSAPESITIYDRRGEVAMVLRERECYFGCHGDNPDFLDPWTAQRVKMGFEEIEKNTRLIDYLPNVDWVLSGANCYGFDRRYQDRACAEAILRNTTKPVVFCSESVETVGDVVDMASAIVGGREKLLSKPYLLCLDEPISPLLHGPESISRVLACADMELPLVYVPMPMAGVSAPSTLIGPVLMGNAESLSGLVIHQLRRKGAPYVYGALPSTADMTHGSFNYGAPELSMMCSAVADMAHYYGLPVWGTGGCCDSNWMDAQAGVEAALSLLSAVLAGANLIHDLGLFSQGLCIAPGFHLINDEIISMVKRVARGIEVDEEALCLDLIDAVGPGGNYLTHEHTLTHFRQMWRPVVFDRASMESLGKGDLLDAGQRAQRRAREIMERHEPEPLSARAREDLAEVTGRWHGEE
ncbi:MAG: trimethylamine methyltransferase family protein [Deltaproteobacteria bacterium]|nr:trimethylamine methyltransferase family protein [Deltaproteobacteria bacterium]MBW2121357.1 trimethylamine methyltransferase family protein [Deltaproteobacteria bacterium]